MTGKPGTFGPAVIGKEQFEKEQAIVKQGAHVFGPLVTGVGELPSWARPPAPAAAAQETAVADLDASTEHRRPEGTPINLPAGLKVVAPTSIVEVDRILKANPATFDVLYEAEKARAEGPRKGALRLFREAEEGQGPLARPVVLSEINAFLAQ